MSLGRWSVGGVFVIVWSVLAQAASRCEIPEVGVYAEAGRLCSTELPASRVQCDRLLESLAASPDRSLEDQLALSFGRIYVASWDVGGGAAPETLDLAMLVSRTELAPFVAGRRNDPMMLLALSRLYYDEQPIDRALTLLREVIDLDPACTQAMSELAILLGAHDSKAARRERLDVLSKLYGQTEGTKKRFYAAWKYRLLGYEGQLGAAEAFRTQVREDMKPSDLPLDESGRAQSVELLCHQHAFELGFAELCLDAIDRLAQRDALARRPLGRDVLEGVFNAAPAAAEGWLGDAGAAHLDRFLTTLDSEVEEHRTPWYYAVYSAVAEARGDQDAAVAALRQAVALDPGSGEIGLWLGGALKRAGRYHEARDAYLHVLANDDGRLDENGLPTDYEEAATRLLDELERGRP